FSNACCILCQNINFNGKEKWKSCLKYLWITKCTYVSFPRETLQTYSTSRPNPKNIYANGCLGWMTFVRSEEHTSELQSRFDLVCRLLLEKKNNITKRSKTD